MIGTQVVVTFFAVASLGGRFRRRIRAFPCPRFMTGKEILLCWGIIGAAEGLVVTRAVSRHPARHVRREHTNLLPIDICWLPIQIP